MFGKRLKECLELRGKKPVDIVNNCGMNKSNLSKYMNGKLPCPKISTCQKIADYLNVNVSYLVGLSDEIYTPFVQVSNSLVENKEAKIRKALMDEIVSVCSFATIDELKTISKLVNTFKK